MKEIVIGRAGTFVRVDDAYAAKKLDEYFPRIREYVGRDDIEPKDVIVRGTLIVNSARDHYYSRFSDGALSEVAEMLPGRPVQANHTYSGVGALGLPLGRFFDATVTHRSLPAWTERDSRWVEGLFYLPNDDEGQRIARRIDLGVYRDTSLAWRCSGVDCSVCKEDIRRCGHMPGEIYERDGICEFHFSGITGVMEGSLVFSGGQKSTSTFTPAGAGRSAPGAVAPEFDFWNRIADEKQQSFAFDDSLDKLLRGDNADQPIRKSLFAVQCGSERFTEAQAASWVREHGFRADKRERDSNAFTFNQYSVQKAGGVVKLVKLDEHVHGLMLKERERGRSESETPLDSILSK